jgi:hypothetical protein
MIEKAVACLVEAGCPRMIAEQARHNPRVCRDAVTILMMSECLAEGQRYIDMPITGVRIDVKERLEAMVDGYRTREQEGVWR